MSKWYNYYKDRVNDRYSKHINKKYAPFIEKLVTTGRTLQVLGLNPIFIELGCGIGSITKAINNIDDSFIHIMIDNDIQILELSKQNVLADNIFRHCNDILSPRLVTMLNGKLQCFREMVNNNCTPIIHSHGVLEHFDDAMLNTFFKHFKHYNDMADIEILHFHYVPSHKYDTPSFGDERLLTVDFWENISKMKVHEFNEGYDYIITNKD